MNYIENPKDKDGCVFCNAQSVQPDGHENLIVHRRKHAYVILNRYPYTSGHLMVNPFQHKAGLDELDEEIRTEMMELTNRCITVLRTIYKPEGFNIGINMGEVAGAGVLGHVHIHIVPRWKGDTNFMSTVGGTRVLPEALEITFDRVHEYFQKSE